jgi:hypothetical protein
MTTIVLLKLALTLAIPLETVKADFFFAFTGFLTGGVVYGVEGFVVKLKSSLSYFLFLLVSNSFTFTFART